MTEAVHDYGQGRAYRRRNKGQQINCVRCLQWFEGRKGTFYCPPCRIIREVELRKIRARRKNQKKRPAPTYPLPRMIMKRAGRIELTKKGRELADYLIRRAGGLEE